MQRRPEHRALEQALCLCARRHVQDPAWDPAAESRLDFDQFVELQRLLLGGVRHGGLVIDRRVENARQLHAFVAGEAGREINADRQTLEAAQRTLAAVEAEAMSAAVSALRSSDSPLASGMGLTVYQKLSQRWVGPVGWMLALWTRLVMLGSGVASFLRLGRRFGWGSQRDPEGAGKLMAPDQLEAAQRSYRTATSDSGPRGHRGRRDEGRGGGWRGRSGPGHGRRHFDEEEEERKPRRRTPAAQVKPFNFEFDDPDAAALTRDDFLKQVLEYDETLRDFGEGEIVKGTIVGIGPTEVLMDIGFKSEGAIPVAEFDNLAELSVGQSFEVYLEKMENQDGLIVLSKTRADFLKVWDRIKAAYDSTETRAGYRGPPHQGWPRRQAVRCRRLPAWLASGRAKGPAMRNAEYVLRPFEDPLPSGVANLNTITFFFAYHDTVHMGVDRAQMNRRLYELLKPGGVLIVADHSARPGDGIGVTKSLHRIEESSLVKEVEAAGFRLVATGDFLRRPEDKRDVIVFSAPTLVDEFVLRFQKPK